MALKETLLAQLDNLQSEIIQLKSQIDIQGWKIRKGEKEIYKLKSKVARITSNHHKTTNSKSFWSNFEISHNKL